MKRLLFSLFSVLLLGLMSISAQTVITSSDTGWNTAAGSLKLTKGGFSISIDKKNGSTAPTIKEDVRIYAKGELTITSEQPMTNIVFEISTNGKKRFATFNPNPGNCAYNNQSDPYTVTWTGNATSVTFTVGAKAEYSSNDKNKAGQICFNKIIITTDGGGVTPQPETVETPTFDLAAGIVVKGTSVSINCATTGAEIRYTLDGTEPTETSTLYNNPIVINEKTTIKAIAIKGTEKSAVATATYDITSTTGYQFVPATTIESGKRYIFVHGTDPSAQLILKAKR